MFDYPPQAQFQRTLPKSKIYEFAKPRRAIRDRFVSQVAEIIWQYKLSPETTNLAAAHGIHEIQIFQITLKTGDLHDDVLRTIDQAIPSPTRPASSRSWLAGSSRSSSSVPPPSAMA